MLTLDFDFRTPSSRPGVVGLALLLAGTLALGLSFYGMHTANTAHDARVAEIAAFEQTQKKRKPNRSRFSRVQTSGESGELAKTRVRANLDYSWQPAFAALEATRSRKIALVSLEASQAKKQLRIVAESRRLADAVEFAQQLNLQPGVKRTGLMQHEVQEAGEQHPVRFTLVMDMAS